MQAPFPPAPRGQTIGVVPPSAPATAAQPVTERVLAPDAAAEHRARLQRLGRSLCGSGELAEDLVQDTYLRVLARPRTMRGDDYGYLARALRNTFLNHLRDDGRRLAPLAAVDVERADPRRSADPHGALMRRELFEAIATLPAAMRDVIGLVDVAGCSYAQAATTLGIPTGTVMSRLHRARARLADVLGDDWR